MKQLRYSIVQVFLQKKYYKYAIALLASLLFKHWYDSKTQQGIDLIRSDMAFGKARLIEARPLTFKGGNFFRWKVYVENAEYEQSTKYQDCDYFILNKWVPVAYYRKNPRYFEILDKPVQFSHYKVPFPDSLDWMHDCL